MGGREDVAETVAGRCGGGRKKWSFGTNYFRKRAVSSCCGMETCHCFGEGAASLFFQCSTGARVVVVGVVFGGVPRLEMFGWRRGYAVGRI